jgi:general secretion pathway protein G
MSGALRNRGFTIIELVVTVAIVALLATAVVPSAQLIYQREREAELRDALRTIRTAIDAYKKATDEGHIKKDVDKSGYPPDLQVLVDGVEDERSATPERDDLFSAASAARPLLGGYNRGGGRYVGPALLCQPGG